MISYLNDSLADPAQIAQLQQRLSRHGAELQGQVPELLLRSPDPEAAVSSWLADKDLSHWWPQSAGGTAADGWQFETARWNRARGAEPMAPWEIGQAHLDGGLDALAAEAMPEAVAIEGLEAALVAAGIALGWWLLRHHGDWTRADGPRRQGLLRQGLRQLGLSALSGLGASLVLSVSLALVPGGQVWLMGLGVIGAVRSLPGPKRDPFQLSPRPEARSRTS